MHHYRLTFTHKGRVYTAASFDMQLDAVPTPFSFTGQICTVMQHRIADTYHIQFAGELMTAIFAWRMNNQMVKDYIPGDSTVVINDVGIGRIISGQVEIEMEKVKGPLPNCSRMPFH